MKLMIDIPDDAKEWELPDIINKGIPIEECDDCVSRQAAIKAIEKLCEECNADYCGECRVKFDGVKNCKTILEQLPPVTPTEKVGRWEWNQYDSNPKIGNFHCSQCHGIGKAYYDYCPYCKAKMLASPTGAESEDKE